MKDIETRPSHALHYSLDTLPSRTFGGYDREATAELFSRLNESYKKLSAEREKLHKTLEDLRESVAGKGENEQHLQSELARLGSELEASKQREELLADELNRAKTSSDGDVRRARGEAERELEWVRAELVGYKKREDLVIELIDGAKLTLEKAKAEAQTEAEAILKEARVRELEIVGDARRELDRLAAERQRIATTAAAVREDLSTVLKSTLAQLASDDRPGIAEHTSAP